MKIDESEMKIIEHIEFEITNLRNDILKDKMTKQKMKESNTRLNQLTKTMKLKELL